MKSILLCSFVLTVSTGAVGCASSVDDEIGQASIPVSEPDDRADRTSDKSSDKTSGDQVFSRTVVWRDEAGKLAFKTTSETLAEQIRARELDEAIAAAKANGTEVPRTMTFSEVVCTSDTLQMFDQPNYVGNHLCLIGGTFTNRDVTDLSLWPIDAVCPTKPNQWWGTTADSSCNVVIDITGRPIKSNKVKSVKPGALKGAFQSTNYPDYVTPYYIWNEYQNIPSASVSNSFRYLVRGNPF